MVNTTKDMRYAIIGPTYPYRGGIAHYTTLLAKHLRKDHEVLLLSFSRQYPSWLFPGKSDKDPSLRPLQTEAEYILDPINPFTWRKTLKCLQGWQPDVIIMPWWHPYFAPAWAWLSRAIKKLPNQPKLIFICHNVLPHEQSKLDKVAVKTALLRGDRFIVHSQVDGKRLKALIADASVRVTSLPTYEALGKNPVPANVKFPDNCFHLLFFGIVRHYKGVDILLEALPAVLKEYPIHLVIAGEFWENENVYQEQIRRLKLETAVTIDNRYIPDEELSGYVRAADVVILPYRSATQSAVVQVALGNNCPVITTDVGGLAEAVEDGCTGLIVPPEDEKALANAILHYFENGLKSVFVENIHTKESKFSWDVLIQNLMP